MRGAVTALGAEDEPVEIEPDEDGELLAYVFKTTADPYTGRINMLRVYSGVLALGLARRSTSTRSEKERIGQLAAPEGKEMTPIDELGPGDIGAVAEAARDPRRRRPRREGRRRCTSRRSTCRRR